MIVADGMRCREQDVPVRRGRESQHPLRRGRRPAAASWRCHQPWPTILAELREADAAVRLEHVADLTPRRVHVPFLAGLQDPGAETGGDAVARDRG